MGYVDPSGHDGICPDKQEAMNILEKQHGIENVEQEYEKLKNQYGSAEEIRKALEEKYGPSGNGSGQKGGSKTYKEVNIHGRINTEIDEVDLVNQIIYEDKSAGKLYMENADFPQTEQQWAFKQIYKKGSNRIDAINQSEYNFSATYGGK